MRAHSTRPIGSRAELVQISTCKPLRPRKAKTEVMRSTAGSVFTFAVRKHCAVHLQRTLRCQGFDSAAQLVGRRGQNVSQVRGSFDGLPRR